MKNKEKILLAIALLQTLALLAFACVQLQQKQVAGVSSLPSANYAFVVDDLDEDERADFCAQ